MPFTRELSLREHPFPTEVSEPYWLFENDATLKSHHSYKDAKAGDVEAATELVADVAMDFLADVCNGFGNEVIFIAPHAREAAGDNAIPQTIAAVCSMLTKAEVDNDIVQSNRVYHTGADPMERMSLRAQFIGEVVQGASYVLVDDVTNMGGTLAELSDYIQKHGGKVVAAIVLVNAGRSKKLVAQTATIKQLEERYHHEIRKIFGIETRSLTANEASYLIGFRSVDEIRNRLAKARKETGLRLRSKGIVA
jgi:hypoxanthine phosphoribosyltransferase